MTPSTRKLAAAAFVTRRRELGLTQREIALRAGVGLRTVQYFEGRRTWPHPVHRASLEKAVSWPNGRLARLAEQELAS